MAIATTRAISVGVIALFVVISVVVIVGPSLASIANTPLNNDNTHAKIWSGSSGAYVDVYESLQVSPNPTQNE
ncbi:MAG: hypothetical protein QXL94_08990, partial [Candidatus Parvarchaeum sp.]